MSININKVIEDEKKNIKKIKEEANARMKDVENEANACIHASERKIYVLEQLRDSQSSHSAITRSRSSPPLSNCLSDYYLDRFGHQSPEDYMNLCISQFDPIHMDDILSLINKEFHQFTPFEVKIVRIPETEERLIYVNFEKPGYAKTIRTTLLPRLKSTFGRGIAIDPAGVIRYHGVNFSHNLHNELICSTSRSEKQLHTTPKLPTLGYGTHSSHNLIIGGVKNWVTNQWIVNEFGQFGEIEQVVYKEGDSHAIIRFVKSFAATNALNTMKNQKLIKTGFITIDYARDSRRQYRPRKRYHDDCNKENEESTSSKAIKVEIKEEH